MASSSSNTENNFGTFVEKVTKRVYEETKAEQLEVLNSKRAKVELNENVIGVIENYLPDDQLPVKPASLRKIQSMEILE